MKRFVTGGVIVLSLALGTTGALAKGKKPKHSAEHTAAVKKCNDDYAAAKKDAMGKKGKDRKDAMATAKKNKAQCIAGAPK